MPHHFEMMESRTLFSGDFNGDGKPDILWRNEQTTQVVAWMLNNGTYTSESTVPGAGADWDIAATADFNGDSKPDILWHNVFTRQNVVWFMNGTKLASAASLPSIPSRDWDIVGAADMTGDGKTDLLWHNEVSGKNVVWQMNGTALVSATALPTLANAVWKPVALGDMNADGKTDLLWRNSDTGQNTVWFLNNLAYAGSAALPALGNLAFQLADAVDYSGDGKTDLLWRNDRTGQVIIWRMNGTALASGLSVKAQPGGQWAVAGMRDDHAAGDFNDDGIADLWWRDAATGKTIVWNLNAQGQVASQDESFIKIADPAWKIAAIADFDNRGGPDILWSNDNGKNTIWFMRGNRILESIALPKFQGTGFEIVGAADLNGDEWTDLLVRSTITGDVFEWTLINGVVQSQEFSFSEPDLDWTIQAVTERDAADEVQLYWKNTATGAADGWILGELTWEVATDLPATTNLGAARDFDGDGDIDIAWYDSTTKQVKLELFDDFSYPASITVNQLAGTGWVMVG
jgi:FG-GAP-like repeat